MYEKLLAELEEIPQIDERLYALIKKRLSRKAPSPIIAPVPVPALKRKISLQAVVVVILVIEASRPYLEQLWQFAR